MVLRNSLKKELNLVSSFDIALKNNYKMVYFTNSHFLFNINKICLDMGLKYKDSSYNKKIIHLDCLKLINFSSQFLNFFKIKISKRIIQKKKSKNAVLKLHSLILCNNILFFDFLYGLKNFYKNLFELNSFYFKKNIDFKKSSLVLSFSKDLSVVENFFPLHEYSYFNFLISIFKVEIFGNQENNFLNYLLIKNLNIDKIYDKK